MYPTVRRVTTLYGLRCTKIGEVCWLEINFFLRTHFIFTERQNLRRLYWHKRGKGSACRAQNRRPGFLLLIYSCIFAE